MGRTFIPVDVAVDVWGVLNKAMILSLVRRFVDVVDEFISFEDENALCKSWSKFVSAGLFSFIVVVGWFPKSSAKGFTSVEEDFAEVDGKLKVWVGSGNAGSSRWHIDHRLFMEYFNTYLGLINQEDFLWQQVLLQWT